MSSLWPKELPLAELKAFAETNMAKHLGIEVLELGPDFLRGRMPVDSRTHQPFGLLHGGASCVLAEALGSYASNLMIDLSRHRAVGIEINANHLKAVAEGYVVGTARPLHLGRTLHVWEIRIETEKEKTLVCVSRLTVLIVETAKLPLQPKGT